MKQVLRIPWFDVIRGLSALAVCAGHIRAAMFCDYRDITTPLYWHLPFYFATGLGHQAVVVFFVLSGFFVGGSVIRNRNNFSWAKYSIARLSRLWTVLVPALIFTFIADRTTFYFAPETFDGTYAQRWNSGPYPENYSLGITSFFCNIAFLQTIVSPVFGSNGPLWSLANEFWYYFMFPCFVAIVFPRPRPASLLFLSIAATLLFLLPSILIYGGAVWCLGIIAYQLSNRFHTCNGWISGIGIPISFLIFIGSLADAKFHWFSSSLQSSISSDLLVGISFSIFALQVSAVNKKLLPAIDIPARWLSDISYTLYLFHFPMVVLIGGVVLNGQQFQPTLVAMIGYLTFIVVVLIISHAAWWLFERNTEAVRDLISKCLANNKNLVQS